jgi:hypothetical protein
LSATDFHRARKRSLLYQFGIFATPVRVLRADDGGVNSRHTQRESQSNRGHLPGVALQKVVIQLLQPLPISLVVGDGRLLLISPGSVGNRPFGDHGHFAFACQGERQIDGFLIRDADRCLQRIEHAAFDCIARG